MRRRDFIFKGGLASIFLVNAPTVFGSRNPYGRANETVNIGIIGTGDRGGGLMPVISQISDLNVVSCSDLLPFRLNKAVSGSRRKIRAYPDYRDLLSDRNVDAVLIATPFSTHSKIALDALEAGKHVYCEKTLAKGYDNIEALLLKGKNAGGVFQTGHQYHSSRLYTHVVDLIRGGKIGKITAFECQWNRNGNWRRAVPDPSLERIINWRLYREFSGGLAAELCSHQIDFVNWVLDDRPEKVMGIGGIHYWKDARETFYNIHLIYSYASGVKAKFTCLTSNSRNDYQIKVLGDQGTIILDYDKAWYYPEGKIPGRQTNVDGVSGATLQWEPAKGIPIEVTHADPSRQALMDFRDSIKNNTLPLSGLQTGAETAICVQMGLDAMINQEIIKWREF